MGRRASTSATCSSARRSTSTSTSPATARAAFSGELAFSANAANNYQRMPHIVTMSSVRQSIPRMWFPEAITQGKAGATHRRRVGAGAVLPFSIPRRDTCRCEMLYKYGSQLFGTMVNGNRWVKAYQHPSLKFVVNQSVWWEGETPYCDVILPACTVFERWDIGEWYNVGTGTCITCTR
jgi:anaerobic selenocysteine-containing dehydrogenase